MRLPCCAGLAAFWRCLVRGFNDQLERIAEVVVVSIVVHGISVTPLMDLYGRRKARRLKHRQTLS